MNGGRVNINWRAAQVVALSPSANMTMAGANLIAVRRMSLPFYTPAHGGGFTRGRGSESDTPPPQRRRDHRAVVGERHFAARRMRPAEREQARSGEMPHHLSTP
jgi:hypothetical protein